MPAGREGRVRLDHRRLSIGSGLLEAEARNIRHRLVEGDGGQVEVPDQRTKFGRSPVSIHGSQGEESSAPEDASLLTSLNVFLLNFVTLCYLLNLFETCFAE